MSLLKRKWEIKGSKWQNLTNKKEISGINRRFCDGKRELGDEESLIVWRISGEVAINENVCRPTYPYPPFHLKFEENGHDESWEDMGLPKARIKLTTLI